MSAGTGRQQPILSFGEPTPGLWGAAWGDCCVVGLGEQVSSGTAAFTIGEPAGEWRVVLDGAELVLTPAAEAVTSGDQGALDQLCLVSGSLAVGATERELSCLGRRALRPAPDPGELESWRDVSAWFEPAGGVSLTAERPRSARGHEHDRLLAAILDADAEESVAEPRLSTTYDASGRPRRAGLELWLSDPDAEEQRLCRAAGVATGSGAEVDCDGLRVRAEQLRWHSRGREGTGVYLLMRPR